MSPATGEKRHGKAVMVKRRSMRLDAQVNILVRTMTYCIERRVTRSTTTNRTRANQTSVQVHNEYACVILEKCDTGIHTVQGTVHDVTYLDAS